MASTAAGPLVEFCYCHPSATQRHPSADPESRVRSPWRGLTPRTMPVRDTGAGHDVGRLLPPSLRHPAARSLRRGQALILPTDAIARSCPARAIGTDTYRSSRPTDRLAPSGSIAAAVSSSGPVLKVPNIGTGLPCVQSPAFAPAPSSGRAGCRRKHRALRSLAPVRAVALAGYGTRDAAACRTTVAASDATQKPSWTSSSVSRVTLVRYSAWLG